MNSEVALRALEERHKESETKLNELKLLLGYRKSHHAALYAHLRTLFARTRDEKDPATGLHGVLVFESGKYMRISAGATPSIINLLGMMGAMQGEIVQQAVARQVGDFKTAQVGDRYNPELGKTQCVSCDDGDPDGSHAEKELRENGKAWLGLVIEVAVNFYGGYLSPRAQELVAELKGEALPADAEVS